MLVRAEDRERLEQFSQVYRSARLREGQGILSVDQARALPYGRPPGFPALYWEVRRQSFAALMGILAREGPTPAAGPAADLGAGFGWLSYRLGELGYDVVAVEASRDDLFGLGAAQRYYGPAVPFLAVQGNLEHPPLRAGRLGLIVLYASLHYAGDLEGTLSRCARALRHGGRLIVVDSPISRRPESGTGRGDRHLGREELSAAMRTAGLVPRWLTVRRGRRWWRRQLAARLKRDKPFSFPIAVGDKE